MILPAAPISFLVYMSHEISNQQKERSRPEANRHLTCILYTASHYMSKGGSDQRMPATISYSAPRTLVEALSLLASMKGEAKVLAGGQSLVPMMNMGIALPEAILDLRHLTDLRYVKIGESTIRIGALTRHAELAESEILRQVCPLVPAAAEWIGHPQIRNRGTIGGSLAHADPAAELPMVLTCLGGSLRIAGPDGERRVAVGSFIQGPYSVALGESELIIEVEVPLPPAGHGWSFQELARRHGDFALVAVAAYLTPAAGGWSGRLALAGAGFGPIDASDLLSGSTALSPDSAARVGARAAELIDPPEDVYVSASYRKRMAAELVQRAMLEAQNRMTSRTEG